MKNRKPLLISIDDITRLFADYLKEAEFPQDAWAEKIQLNPSDRRIKLVVSADSLQGPQQPEVIKFQLRRTHLVH